MLINNIFILDNFVIDTAVSSSELLSDVSDSNIITFEEPSNDSHDEHLFHYYATSILIIVLMVLVLTVKAFL